MSDPEKETSFRWWMRYVVVPLIGSGGIVAILIALIDARSTNRPTSQVIQDKVSQPQNNPSSSNAPVSGASAPRRITPNAAAQRSKIARDSDSDRSHLPSGNVDFGVIRRFWVRCLTPQKEDNADCRPKNDWCSSPNDGISFGGTIVQLRFEEGSQIDTIVGHLYYQHAFCIRGRYDGFGASWTIANLRPVKTSKSLAFEGDLNPDDGGGVEVPARARFTPKGHELQVQILQPRMRPLEEAGGSGFEKNTRPLETLGGAITLMDYHPK